MYRNKGPRNSPCTGRSTKAQGTKPCTGRSTKTQGTKPCTGRSTKTRGTKSCTGRSTKTRGTKPRTATKAQGTNYAERIERDVSSYTVENREAEGAEEAEEAETEQQAAAWATVDVDHLKCRMFCLMRSAGWAPQTDITHCPPPMKGRLRRG